MRRGFLFEVDRWAAQASDEFVSATVRHGNGTGAGAGAGAGTLLRTVRTDEVVK